jgi:hypothetical protein
MRLTTVLLLVGCTSHDHAYLADDVDLNLDFRPEVGLTLGLSSPYVRGTEVTIYAHHTDEDRQLIGWRIDSDTPEVLMPVTEATGTSMTDPATTFVAVAEGTATITAYDGNGRAQIIDEINVMAPDRSRVLAHGPLILQRGEDAATVPGEVTILEGGSATFLVQYFNGNVHLRGNGVLAAPAPDTLTTSPRTSFLFENREWLTVTASTPGVADVEIVADGITVGTLRVNTVPATAVAAVGIEKESESGHEAGDSLVALAEASDGQAGTIYGVEFDWDLEGEPAFGENGDLFRYRYAPGDARTLTATFGEHTASTVIHADEGSVGSTNTVGCAVAAGRRALRFPALVLALAALALRRRRCNRV